MRFIGRGRRGAPLRVSEVVDVSENNNEAASGSEEILNSRDQLTKMKDIPPTGVTDPGIINAPPITIISRTLCK